MAFDIVKEFPTSEPEDFVPGSIVTIKKGHARYGFISSEKGAFFIVYASEKEMPIGTIPEGTQDGELNPIIGFNVYCVEQIEGLADFFRTFAEHCKEHPEFLKPVEVNQDECPKD
jgi:antirestriction protein ArdC